MIEKYILCLKIKISTDPKVKIQVGFSVLAIVILRHKMLLNIRYEQ